MAVGVVHERAVVMLVIMRLGRPRTGCAAQTSQAGVGWQVRVDGKDVPVDSGVLRKALSRPGWGPTQLVVRADAQADDVTLARVLSR